MRTKPKLIVVGAAAALGVAGIVAGTAFASSPTMSTATNPAGAVSLTANQQGQPTQGGAANKGDQTESGESATDADSTHEDSG